METSAKTIINLYKKGNSLLQIAKKLGLTRQSVGASLKRNLEGYKPSYKAGYAMPKGGIKSDEPMTDAQKEAYADVIEMYKMLCDNPTIKHAEIAQKFGLVTGTVSAKLRQMRKHLKTGEPFFPPRAVNKSTKGKRVYGEIPAPKKPRIKDPDAEWARLYKEGKL